MNSYKDHQQHVIGVRKAGDTINLIAGFVAAFWALVIGLLASSMAACGVTFVVVFVLGKMFLWVNYNAGTR
jgi:hypothetical protein